MKILGIDPGIARVGWGLVEKKGGDDKYLDCGLISTSKNIAEPKRLKEIYEQTCDIIKSNQPNLVAIEKLYFFKNQKTAFTVSQARGVIVLAAADSEVKIASYTPLQIKQSVSGYGQASKAQVGSMVKMILNLNEVPKPDDVADGLACAICASSHQY
jgi:crossover junction endodeoxyribonuclease RuvC